MIREPCPWVSGPTEEFQLNLLSTHLYTFPLEVPNGFQSQTIVNTLVAISVRPTHVHFVNSVVTHTVPSWQHSVGGELRRVNTCMLQPQDKAYWIRSETAESDHVKHRQAFSTFAFDGVKARVRDAVFTQSIQFRCGGAARRPTLHYLHMCCGLHALSPHILHKCLEYYCPKCLLVSYLMPEVIASCVLFWNFLNWSRLPQSLV